MLTSPHAPRRRSRWVLAAALGFLAGLLAGVATAYLRVRSWITPVVANQTRAIVIYDLEALARLRTGNQAQAISLLEDSVFQGATSILRSTDWGSLSPKERKAIQLVKRYGDRIGWTGAESAMQQLQSVPTEDLDVATCSTALSAFLGATPEPERKSEPQ